MVCLRGVLNISVIFIVNSKTALVWCCLRNWVAELNCKWRITAESRCRAALWFPQLFCLCKVSETKVLLSFNLLASFTVKCNDSVSFSFLFPCFLFYLFVSSTNWTLIKAFYSLNTASCTCTKDVALNIQCTCTLKNCLLLHKNNNNRKWPPSSTMCSPVTWLSCDRKCEPKRRRANKIQKKEK